MSTRVVIATLVLMLLPCCGGEDVNGVAAPPGLAIGRGGARLHGQNPLQGAGWFGGDEVRPYHHGKRRLAILFFDPGDATSSRTAALLVSLSREHEDLGVVGATRATDLDAIRAFQQEAGAGWPVVYGYGTVTREAYDVGQVPSIRVLDKRGEVIGRDVISLRAMLLD